MGRCEQGTPTQTWTVGGRRDDAALGMEKQTEMKIDDPLTAALSYLQVSPDEDEKHALRYLLQAIADGQGAPSALDPILHKGELGELTAALLDALQQRRYSVMKWQQTYRSTLNMANNAPLIQYPRVSNFASELSGAGDVPAYVPEEIRLLCKQLESGGHWFHGDLFPNNWERKGVDPLTAKTVAEHLSGHIRHYIHPYVVRQLTYQLQPQKLQHQLAQEKLWSIVNSVAFTNEERVITDFIINTMKGVTSDVPDSQSQLKVFRYGELMREISYAYAYKSRYSLIRGSLRKHEKPKRAEQGVTKAIKELQKRLKDLGLNYTIREIVGKQGSPVWPAVLDQTSIIPLLDLLEEKVVAELKGVRDIASLKHKASEDAAFIRTILPPIQRIFGDKSNDLIAYVVNLVLRDYDFTSRDVKPHVDWLNKLNAAQRAKVGQDLSDK